MYFLGKTGEQKNRPLLDKNTMTFRSQTQSKVYFEAKYLKDTLPYSLVFHISVRQTDRLILQDINSSESDLGFEYQLLIKDGK